MYSPALSPSSTRAAPAKNRSWSTQGGTSSVAVRCSGLPVLRDSTATNSSARASTASANRSIASWRSAGVVRPQEVNAVDAAAYAASTSTALLSGARAYSTPVDGSTTAVVRPSAAGRSSPPTTLRSSMDCSVAWLTGVSFAGVRRSVAPYAAEARRGSPRRGIAPIERLWTSKSEVLAACHNEFLASGAVSPHDLEVGTRRPTPSHPALDDVSKAIVEQLQEDGRRPYATIGKAIGLSEAAVRQRVQRLTDSGVMQIVAVTDPLQVGFTRQAMIGLRCEGDLSVVADALADLQEVDYVVVTAGGFDLLCEVVCEDDDHLLEVLNQKIRTIEGVRTTEAFVYLKLRKQLYNWGTR